MRKSLFCVLPMIGVLGAQDVELVNVEIWRAVPEVAKDVVWGNPPESGEKLKAGFLLLPAEGEMIIGVEDKSSKVTAVADATTGEASKAKVSFGSFPRVAEGGGPAYLTLEYSAADDAPSGRIKVTGMVVVKISKGSTTEKSEAVEVKDGSVAELGGLSLKIGDLKTGDGKTNLSLTSGKSLDGVKALRFLDKDGKELEARRQGSSRMSMMGKVTEVWNFEVEGEHESLVIEMDLFEAPETREVPVVLTLPAGL